MSQSEIDRLVADLKSDTALRTEAEKTAAGRVEVNGVRTMPMAAFVSFAARQGYTFTADEMMERVRAAKARAERKQLTDVELDGVAGGGDPLDGVFSGSTWRGSDGTAVFVSFDEDVNNLSLGVGNEANHIGMVVIPNEAAMDDGMKSGAPTRRSD